MCSEETKFKGDPDCAADLEIEKYLAGKYLYYNTFGYKVDFALDNERGLREMFIMQKSIPVQVGKFSDVGYRFKFNSFSLTDDIFGLFETFVSFFELLKYNEDTLDIAPGARG